MKRLLTAVGLAMSMLLCGGAAADETTLARIVEKKEVRVGMSGNQPPFAMKDRAGRLVGFDVDLAESIADAMGVRLTLVSKPFAELLPALERGEVDLVMSGLTMTPERSLDFAFVGPYYVSGKSVLTKSDELAGTGETEAFDREGLKLVALAGSTSEAYVKERLSKADLTTVPDYDKAVAMVLEDRAAAMVADLPACVVAMLRNPNKGLKTSATLLTTEPIGIALPPDQPRLDSYVTNILEAIDEVGELDELADYWFKGAGWLSDVP